MLPKFIVLAVSAIALLSLPSCTTNSSTTVAATPTSSSIKVGGSTSTVGLISVLDRHYSTIHQKIKINQLQPGQSESVIEGIKLGIVDVGAISKQSLAQAIHNSALDAREIAHDLLLVAAHPSVTGVPNLTTQNLRGIYSGKITNWQQLGGPNANIVLLDRPEDESAKQLLRKYYLGNNLKSSSKAIILRKEKELIQTLQSTPYSIGAFSLAYATQHQLKVQHFSLNGFAPTAANYRAGKYPMVRKISMVWHKNSSPITQNFIQSIFSPQAANVLQQSGFIPVTP